MAKPRIFVSSTYYDLKYIRASLELFIESLGFDAILSEKGDIAYTYDRPLDESCYREVENSDMFILIVGGRYGSEISAGAKKRKEFFDRYESITKKEYSSAVDKDIPVYVLIEKAVYAEYQTFIRNKDVNGIKYAHVDSVNVFLLIEDIVAKPRNNPVQTFEKFEDIESWLREQWAGLFRELLRRQSQQQQLAGLSQQVLQLKETNETLKKYLEAVMRGIGKQETSKLIKSEERRLSEIRQLELLRKNTWMDYIVNGGVPFEGAVAALREASGFEDYADRIRRLASGGAAERFTDALHSSNAARDDLNKARRVIHLPPFEVPDNWSFDRVRKPAERIERRSLDTASTMPVPGHQQVRKKAVRVRAPKKPAPPPVVPDKSQGD